MLRVYTWLSLVGLKLEVGIKIGKVSVIKSRLFGAHCC